MAPWVGPYEIENCTPEEDKLIKKCILGYTKTFIKCGKGKYVMPGAFKECAADIYNMEVRPTDVWVITFPRSGTTWTQEMVWMLKNNLDYETSKRIPLYDRFPMLEVSGYIPDIAFQLIKFNFMNLANFQGLNKAVRKPSWISIQEDSSTRFIKTHLPLSLLPPKLLEIAKVVYVARDPRDVAVSYYYLHKMVSKALMRSNMKQFWEVFRRNLLPWTPIITHTNEAWQQRHHPNLHFVFYEDMLKDLPNAVKRMSKFLETPYSDAELLKLSQYLSFDNLRKNRSVNNTTGNEKDEVQFIRKGEAGGWVQHFDEKMQLQAEEYLIEHLQGKSLSYPYFSLYETTHL